MNTKPQKGYTKHRVPSLPDFARRIRIAMAAHDLNSTQLAAEIGYTPINVQGWCHGRINPQRPAMDALCDFFHCSYDWLYGIAPLGELEEPNG